MTRESVAHEALEVEDAAGSEFDLGPQALLRGHRRRAKELKARNAAYRSRKPNPCNGSVTAL